MRFKVLLPIAQIIAMVFLAWSSLPSDAGKIRSHGPRSRALEWSQGINLPAVAVVAPLEFAVRESQGLPNYRVRFYGYVLVGFLCWWMAGRFLDEIVQCKKAQTLHRAPRADLTFALIAFPSTILMVAAFGLTGTESRVISAWATIWLIVTSADMLFRIVQLIRHRRRPKFS